MNRASLIECFRFKFCCFLARNVHELAFFLEVMIRRCLPTVPRRSLIEAKLSNNLDLCIAILNDELEFIRCVGKRIV